MLTLCTVVERMVLYGPGDRHVSRIDNHRCQVPWELKQNWMQGQQYGWFTLKGNTITAPWGCSALGVQFVGNSQKGELNRKNKQRSEKYQGEKTAKDYFLELSTPWMPGTGHTEDISRPSDRVKNSTEKKARKLCITYLKTKKNRRLEFQRLNYSLSIAHFSVSGSSNSNLIAHLLGNLS